jgi:isopentenyldiphosphate isomerase
MRIIVVDENDTIIGDIGRDELYGKEDTTIYRVTALWLTNSRGDILLAQRSHSKKHDPGIWGPAVAGTVEAGETYDKNIAHEIEEELGLKGLPLTIGPKQRVSGSPYNYFVQWYLATLDKPAEAFVIQKEEVEQVRWFTRKELIQDLHRQPERYFEQFSWVLKNL